MTKKKGSSAADDLIKSLLDNMNDDGDSHPSTVNIFDEGTKEAGKTNLTLADDKTIPLRSPHFSEYEGDKVVLNTARPKDNLSGLDSTLIMAENLKMAQTRILQLEQEVDILRQENEQISSSAEVIKNKNEDLNAKKGELEREIQEVANDAQGEMLILRGQIEYKETELRTALQKIDELEQRLKTDFRKIRVRERELENRLELMRAEKSTLVRSKDDSILELKRKVDQLQHEIDNYREKCLELNKTLESHKEQFKRTVKALKLALTNLEVKEDLVALKKAE